MLFTQSLLILKALALRRTCCSYLGERTIVPSPGLALQTGQETHFQCVLLNNCRHGRKIPVWNQSCFSSGNTGRGVAEKYRSASWIL